MESVQQADRSIFMLASCVLNQGREIKEINLVALSTETFSSINFYAIYARIDHELQIKGRKIIQLHVFIDQNFLVDQFLCNLCSHHELQIKGREIIQLLY